MTNTTPETGRIAAPPPGIYDNIPAEEYHRWDAISNSLLTQADKSAEHAKYVLDGGSLESEAKIRGTALHAATLEPELFEQTYALGPKVDLRTKAGKAEWEAFQSAHPDKLHLRGEEVDKVLGMRTAILAHPKASLLIRTPGRIEVSVVWDDPATGLRCKCRFDKLMVDQSLAADVKSTRDASEWGFGRSARNYGYDRQAAFYSWGLAQHKITLDRFIFIPVESTEPFHTATYYINDADLEASHGRIAQLMQRLKVWKESNTWPGYGGGLFTPLRLPRYRAPDDEELAY